MNILIFSWRDPKHPVGGGAEQVMHEHAKGWVAAGHQVTLFSSNFKNAQTEEILDGITVLRSGSQLLDVQIRGCWWYLFGKHPKFDLVVDQFHGIPFFTPLYVRVKKLAVLQEVAREVWLMNHLPKPFNWIIGWIGYLTEPYIFLFYKKIPFLTGSDSAKQDLVKFGIPRSLITVISHGIIIPKLNSRVLKKEKIKTLIYLGALARDKGVEDAIVAFGQLNKLAEYQFWIVGKGSDIYNQRLNELILRHGLTDKVKFWGFVSEQKKFELLAKAHLLVNPSAREGWGLVNIEANAVGTPVIAYRSPGLVDSVKDGQSGLFCQSNTPKSLAETIEKVLTDKGLYIKLEKGARLWSEKFSWSESQKKSLELIEEL